MALPVLRWRFVKGEGTAAAAPSPFRFVQSS